MTKFYQQILCSEELPETNMTNVCIVDFEGEFQHVMFRKDGVFFDKEENDITEICDYWLREFPFEELMIGFAECAQQHDWNYTGWTMDDLLEDYLKLKGIIKK
jgi:hypothetical protein